MKYYIKCKDCNFTRYEGTHGYRKMNKRNRCLKCDSKYLMSDKKEIYKKSQ